MVPALTNWSAWRRRSWASSAPSCDHPGLRGTGIIDDIVGKVKYQGVDVVVYDKIESNPKDYNCMEIADLYVKEKCDSFISVGGGSTTDATKGARLVVAHDGRNVNEFDGFNKSENPDNPPHIAINTTAGTGSETSWAFVITDTTSDKAPYKWLGFDDNCPTTLEHQRSGAVLLHAAGPDRLLRLRRSRARLRALRLAPRLHAQPRQLR